MHVTTILASSIQKIFVLLIVTADYVAGNRLWIVSN